MTTLISRSLITGVLLGGLIEAALAQVAPAPGTMAPAGDTGKNKENLSLTPHFGDIAREPKQIYDYPEKSLYAQPFGDQGATLRLAMMHLAQPDFDVEAFINSPLGEGVAKISQNFILYKEEMDPQVVSYWAHFGKGLKKELHNADDSERKWSSFVPLSAYQKGNEHRVYPVVFVMHGFNNPIFFAEGFGYTHLAAKEEFIVVIPWLRTDEMIQEILQTLSAHYPVDTSRVYCAGFSGGSFATLGLALGRPRQFAAVALGGAYFGTHNLRDPEPSAQMIADAKRYRIPAINIVGTQDANWYPIIKDGNQGFMATSKVKIEGLNVWLDIDGYGGRHVSFDTAANLVDLSNNRVESLLGVAVDRATIIRSDTRYYVGDLKNVEGQYLLRIVLEQDVPHHPSANLSAMAWDFMKQFSRDPRTGELRYHPNPVAEPAPSTF